MAKRRRSISPPAIPAGKRAKTLSLPIRSTAPGVSTTSSVGLDVHGPPGEPQAQTTTPSANPMPATQPGTMNANAPLQNRPDLIISFADLRPRAGYCYDDVERAPRRVRKAFKKCFAAASNVLNRTAFDRKLVEIFDAAASRLTKALVFDSALARDVINSVSWTEPMDPTGLAQIMGYFYRARLHYFDRMADPGYRRRHQRPSCASAQAVDRLYLAAMAKVEQGTDAVEESTDAVEQVTDADLTALLSAGSDVSPFAESNEPIWVPCDSDDDTTSECGRWVYPNDDNGSGSDDADDDDEGSDYQDSEDDEVDTEL